MSARLTARQRRYLRKITREHDLDPSETSDELNIVPFLDIVVNLIMFLLMTLTAVAFFSQINSNLPVYRTGKATGTQTQENPLNLNLTITKSGIILAGSGGKLAPGCTMVSPGSVITVPTLANQEQDWNGLTNCVAEIKKEFPDETKVTISADPLIPYDHVVHAMDAVRAQGPNELFPDVLLSAGVR